MSYSKILVYMMALSSHTPATTESRQSMLSQRSSINIGSVNVNSLIALSRRYELLNFTMENSLDVVLLCETKLCARYKLQFEGFNFVRTNRSTECKGGGTAIIIKDTIPYEQIYVPSSRSNKIVEYTIIKVRLGQRSLFLVALYANNEADAAFTEELDVLFNKLNLHLDNNFFIIAGDFNARHTAWGDNVTKRKGILLKRWIENEGLNFRAKIIPPSLPTFPSAGSYLDLCIIDSRLLITDLTEEGKVRVLDYGSDHRALVFTIDSQSSLPTCDPAASHRFSFKKTRWKIFENRLARRYTSVVPANINLKNEEIVEHIARLKEAIRAEIVTTVPKYRPRDNVLIYTNRSTRALHRTKSSLVTALNRLLTGMDQPPDRQARIVDLKRQIAQLSASLKADYRLAYNKYWDCQKRSINHKDSSSFFPKINRFFRPKSQLRIESLEIEKTNTPILDRANIALDDINTTSTKVTVHSPTDILNMMDAYFETINAPRYTNTGTNHRKLIDRL